MSGENEICRMDAVTLALEIRDKRLSPVDVVDAVLDRMERLEPLLHAFCTPAPDLARSEAKRVEKDIVAGSVLGPLAGVPVSVKDLILTKDIRTVAGSRAYADFLPEEDDVVVERLREAGAVILGKTNVPEFGYSGAGHNQVFETTRNPWNLDMTPGGSSSGAGAAVAAGMGAVALGSDGGGSIRVPSSFCGLFGIKASMGRVPLYPGCRDERFPGLSSWESVEHIGPMSRTVADAALMLSVIVGPDDRDRHSLPSLDFEWTEALKGEIEGARIAYSPDWGYAAIDPRVREIVGDAVMVFERELGCRVEEAHPGLGNELDAFWALVAVETDLKGMRTMADRLGEGMSPNLVDFLRRDWTAEDLTDAIVTRKSVNNKMWRFMRQYDLIVTPTLAVPAFPIGIQGPENIGGQAVEPFDWFPFTFPMNFTGQPAATVPAGWTDDGLPVGMQIAGRRLDDLLVLRACAAFEAAAPWKDRWPPLLESMDL
jgi:aspartyl-tRNA(Asn)/glutamyl-tRNA(Gln) amidotransferase subunit A